MDLLPVEPSRIRALRANVPQAEAARALAGSGLAGLLRRATLGPLRSLADVYVPFHVYEVRISNNASVTGQLFALDAVSGMLDPYRLDHVPNESDTIEIGTRNRIPATLDPESGKAILCEKVRRMLFLQGFFRLRGLKLEATYLPATVHFPYWVAFFGGGESAAIRVLDALRRQPEGTKVRQLMASWLTT